MFKAKNKTKEPKNFTKAYDYAVYILGISLRTQGEMRQKLKDKGFSPDIIDQIISELLKRKYVDDQRYAEAFLENLKKYKNFGYYGVKKKFMEKGLPSEIIERVLSEGMTTDDELLIGLRFLKKNQAIKDKTKLALKLKARGFRAEVIAKLLF